MVLEVAENTMQTNLNRYNNSWFNPGAGMIKRMLWYLTNHIFFQSYLFPFSGLKVLLLRLFGASVGKNLMIKPNINIKYPWNLSIGDDCWIGEGVWIDNLGKVVIGKNVCISQSAYLLTGNHNYSKATFDLIVTQIQLEDGVWIGAKSLVCPGVTCKTHAVLGVMSVATKDLQEYTIYQGNPAAAVKQRIIR